MKSMEELQREAAEIAAEDDGYIDQLQEDTEEYLSSELRASREEAAGVIRALTLGAGGVPPMNPCKHNDILFPSEIETAKIYTNMSMDTYHRIDAFNASTGKAFMTSGLHGAAYLEGEPDPPTNEMLEGTAQHARELEYELYKRQKVLGTCAKGKPLADGCTWEKHAEAIETYGKDKIILHTGWEERIERVHEAIERSEHARKYFEDPELLREITILWLQAYKIEGVEMRIPCKARLDLFSPRYHAVVDLKMTASAEPFAFEKIVHKLGYYRSAGFYMHAACVARLLRRDEYGRLPERPFVFIVPERTPIRKSSSIHLVGTFALSEAVALQGYEELMTDGMDRYLRYRIAGHAEGPGWANEVKDISIPNYAMSDQQPRYQIGA
ncbi:MAG: PD-(D/E)XK nuclease-like domain-containing protein [Phycisphaerales bacterium]